MKLMKHVKYEHYHNGFHMPDYQTITIIVIIVIIIIIIVIMIHELNRAPEGLNDFKRVDMLLIFDDVWH